MKNWQIIEYGASWKKLRQEKFQQAALIFFGLLQSFDKNDFLEMW
jgi:hypothetical protein